MKIASNTIAQFCTSENVFTLILVDILFRVSGYFLSILWGSCYYLLVSVIIVWEKSCPSHYCSVIYLINAFKVPIFGAPARVMTMCLGVHLFLLYFYSSCLFYFMVNIPVDSGLPIVLETSLKHYLLSSFFLLKFRLILTLLYSPCSSSTFPNLWVLSLYGLPQVIFQLFTY